VQIQAQFDSMLKRFKALEQEYHPPPNPAVTPADERAYCDHISSNRGFVAPWM